MKRAHWACFAVAGAVAAAWASACGFPDLTYAPGSGGASTTSTASSSSSAPSDAGMDSTATGAPCDGGKICNGACIPIDDPATGCGAPDCAPCGLKHATAKCDNGACAVAACDMGHDDCDHLPANGCEADLSRNPDNCGACGVACAVDGAVSRVCAKGLCNPTCQIGKASCDVAPPAMPDDGCEQDVSSDPAACGDCKAQCAGSLSCASSTCGCSIDNDCGLGGGAAGTCSNRICSCGGVACQPGEGCKKINGVNTCACHQMGGCLAGETCCAGGCKDLMTTPGSCGACGRACTGGFSCEQGVCKCTSADQCTPNSNMGSCDVPTGLCVCGGSMCAVGQRCMPNGSCG